MFLILDRANNITLGVGTYDAPLEGLILSQKRWPFVMC
jgi:hypothetical protein